MIIASLDIDAQKAFTPLCPNELPIQGGDEIVAELNAQAQLAQFRIMSKDAHTLAARWLCQHPRDNGSPTNLPNAPHRWVAHAIIGTRGFELLDGLPAEHDYDFCVWKGISPEFHPYGACFHDFREKLSTGLIEWLHNHKVDGIIVGGLATDYCVKSTVLQLLRNGNWQIFINQAACRGIAPDTSHNALAQMVQHGAKLFDNAAAIHSHLQQIQNELINPHPNY